MQKTIRLAVFFILLLVTFRIDAAPLAQHHQLKKGKLSNGVTYYIYPNQYPKGEAVYRLFIKSGSVFETDDQQGLAHFLEHMAFNGTKNFPGNMLIHFLESKGAKFGKDLNAHTSFNETVYKLQLPSSNPQLVDSTLTILADWADGLLLDSAEIESERGVILSEWLSKTGPEKDISNALLMELLNGSRFSKRIVIGDTAVIRNFEHSTLRNYYEKWYHPQLMAVAVVGDVNVSEIEKLIQQKFGSISNSPKVKVKNYGIPDYTKNEARVMVHPSLKKIELSMIQLLPMNKAVRNSRDYPAYLERTLLNRLMKARLSSKSFNNTSYNNGNVSVSDFLNTKSVFLSSAELVPGKVNEGIDSFMTHFEQMYRYGFLSVEINKVKKTYLSQIARRASSTSPVASQSIMDEIYSDFYRGNLMITPQAEYELLKKYIDKVDSAQLIRLFRKSYRPQSMHFQLSAFEKAKNEILSEDALISKFKKISSVPVQPYRKEISVPDSLLTVSPVGGRVLSEDSIPEINASVYNLSNGVKVIFKKSVSEKGRISLSAFRKGGLYALDSVDYVSGIFAGSVVSLSGAGAFTRDALSHYLAGNTASVRFLVEKTRSGLVGGAHVNDAETLFQLLYLKWTEPRLDTLVFEQTKKMSIDNYLTKNKTEQTKYFEDMARILKKEDYSTKELTDSVIHNEVKMEKILPVFNESFGNASDYTFVITSDTTFDAIRPYVLKYIGGLPSGKQMTAYQYKGGVVNTARTVFERKAGDSPKASVSLVFQQTKLPVEFDLYNLQSEILANVLKMKLTKSLREEMGMVYSVGVNSSATIRPSALSRSSISFSCLPVNVQPLIEKSKEIIQNMKTKPEGFESELKDVKANMIKEMELNKQKDSFWSTYIRNSIFNNQINWDFVTNYDAVVESITVNDLAVLLSNNFSFDNLIQCVLFPKENQESKPEMEERGTKNQK
ncbi:MAG: insulinase family protein [Paludibacter sp.]|nr:insulinase family protein [Paludibacter sp.]